MARTLQFDNKAGRVLAQALHVTNKTAHSQQSDSSSNYDNDFAIIKLSSSVTFNARVLPVCLPSASTNYDSEVATVTGWGTLSSGGSQPTVLQKVIDNTAGIHS